jgi:hypothetical protein
MHAADRVPFARGVVRMTEMVATLPLIRQRLPDSRFSFESGNVAATALACTVLAALARRRGGFRGELTSTLIGVVPSLVTLRSRDLVRYHGAEHKTVAGYEQGVAAETTAKEHERCGSHLVAPLLLGAVVAATIAARARAAAPPGGRGRVACVDGLRVRAVRLGERHPGSFGARALAVPGTALQRARDGRAGRGELEVAKRALAALLVEEDSAASA